MHYSFQYTILKIVFKSSYLRFLDSLKKLLTSHFYIRQKTFHCSPFSIVPYICSSAGLSVAWWSDGKFRITAVTMTADLRLHHSGITKTIHLPAPEPCSFLAKTDLIYLATLFYYIIVPV